MLAAEGLLFFDLSELEHFFVGFLLCKFLEASHLVDVTTLEAGVVTTVTYFLDDTRTLNALLEAANYVRAAFVVISFNLDVYCHMWAREYHFVAISASLSALR